MFMSQIKPIWPDRLSRIDSKVEDIRLPDVEDDLSQDAEWCEVVVEGEPQRVRFHDYDEVYKIPGFFENLFYVKLKCCSPSRIAYLMDDVLADNGSDPRTMRVLDLGAGNGMVGDELRLRHVQHVVGIDIIPEAKEATYRDRPGVYDDYYVTDLTQLPTSVEKRLCDAKLNCLTVVAALGFGDMPPLAFMKGLDVLETPSWVALTIKENFLQDRETSGFQRLLRQLTRDQILQVHTYRRYRHRVSMTGQPLHYVAMVARKQKDIPPGLFAEYEPPRER